MIATTTANPNQQNALFQQTDQHLWIKFDRPWPILSSAVLGGGWTHAQSLLNLRVQATQQSHYPPADQTLNDYSQQLQLPAPTSAMMTAASMQSLGYCDSREAPFFVQCYVTSGLANLRRPGDIADDRLRAGTINIWLLVHHRLSPAAMAEALMQVTEAKVTAIRDLGLVSALSALPASGTGTDSHAVLCAPEGEALAYCGKHTKVGELIGQVVLDACLQSLKKCLAAG